MRAVYENAKGEIVSPWGFDGVRKLHEKAGCANKGNCTGPGCRLRHSKRVPWWMRGN